VEIAIEENIPTLKKKNHSASTATITYLARNQ
jgi:hypothetical protein